MLNQNNELNELDAESSPANTTAHHLFQNSNFTNDSKLIFCSYSITVRF